MRTMLQVPLSSELKAEATLVAKAQGFSSLQEVVRVMLNKLVANELRFGITESVKLSPAAEKRYLKMLKDFEAGKNTRVANSVAELMEQLHES